VSIIEIVLIAIVIAGFCCSLCFCGALLLLFWVAKGESDVNGDPERDAGHTLSDRTFPRIIREPDVLLYSSDERRIPGRGYYN
jgi:hypothetical protein